MATEATTSTADVGTRPRIDLRRLFAPASIAVVGASPRSTIASTVRDNLVRMGSATRCYFVNPRYETVFGSPCFPSLDALPERPDTVLLAVNPLRAAQFTAEAVDAGIPSLIIPGGGIVEGGAAAARMQREVAEIAARHGIALLGPNCMGMIDFTTNAATYIGDVSPYLPRGGIAGIAQSGSVTDAYVHSGTRIGFSRIISCGAEVTLDLCDYLAYCLDDPETHAVILFVEGFKRPERFLALADRAVELDKPIAIVKVGRSSQAQEAALAHSGSLAGEARVTDAALRAAGVIRCQDLDELLETAELIEGCRRLGRRVGRGRTGVVTVSTGEASLIADLAPAVGLDLPPVPDATRDAILRDLPTLGYIGNPLDPWGATDAATGYRACFEAFAASEAYDVLALVYDFPYRSLAAEIESSHDALRPLLEVTADRPDIVPVYVSLTSGEPPPETQALLDAAGGAPLLRGTVEAFRAIGSLAGWERHRERRLRDGPVREGWPAAADDRTPYAHDGPGVESQGAPARALTERESLAMLRAAGVPVVAAEAVADRTAAIAAAERVGYPVALKLDAAVAHKTEVGGVELGLEDREAVGAAAELLLARGLDAGVDVRGLLVEPMAPPGVELIVGLRRDALFGPVVLVGLGGVFAEAFDDVAIRLAPVAPDEARRMLEELRGARILTGFRGGPAADVDAVVELLVGIGRLGVERSEIREIDLNPLVVGTRGALAVDALVVVAVPEA